MPDNRVSAFDLISLFLSLSVLNIIRPSKHTSNEKKSWEKTVPNELAAIKYVMRI